MPLILNANWNFLTTTKHNTVVFIKVAAILQERGMERGWGGGEELVGDGLDTVLTVSSRSYLDDVTRLYLHNV